MTDTWFICTGFRTGKAPGSGMYALAERVRREWPDDHVELYDDNDRPGLPLPIGRIFACGHSLGCNWIRTKLMRMLKREGRTLTCAFMFDPVAPNLLIPFMHLFRRNTFRLPRGIERVWTVRQENDRPSGAYVIPKPGTQLWGFHDLTGVGAVHSTIDHMLHAELIALARRIKEQTP